MLHLLILLLFISVKMNALEVYSVNTRGQLQVELDITHDQDHHLATYYVDREALCGKLKGYKGWGWETVLKDELKDWLDFKKWAFISAWITISNHGYGSQKNLNDFNTAYEKKMICGEETNWHVRILINKYLDEIRSDKAEM